MIIAQILRPLHKGSKNPPIHTPILLKYLDEWGLGEAFYSSGKIYFNFRGIERSLYGEPKDSFVAWAELPN